MYRDDPLDDEEELRAILGDPAVDRLVDVGMVGDAVDVLRVLQGWVDDERARDWFRTSQRRLDGRSPLEGLVDGDSDEVRDAARHWVAAHA
jgi:hypothetical protein